MVLDNLTQPLGFMQEAGGVSASMCSFGLASHLQALKSCCRGPMTLGHARVCVCVSLCQAECNVDTGNHMWTHMLRDTSKVLHICPEMHVWLR